MHPARNNKLNIIVPRLLYHIPGLFVKALFRNFWRKKGKGFKPFPLPFPLLFPASFLVPFFPLYPRHLTLYRLSDLNDCQIIG